MSIKSYPLCKKAGFTIIELSMDFSKRAVWADDVEAYLRRLENLIETVESLQPENKEARKQWLKILSKDL